MNISFKLLANTDFENLLKWLQQPHVKKWWPVAPKLQSSVGGDADVNYTKEAIQEKYASYVDGYKKIGSKRKPIHAFIIYFDDTAIGYIQYYNAYDFTRDGYELNNLPTSLAAIDFFIGDENYLGKGIGAKSLELFLDSHVFTEFDYALVDPNSSNLAAIKTYQWVGFALLSIIKKRAIMVAHKKIVRLPVPYSIKLELAFKECWLPDDSIWVFGSRADLNKKGGDIDLYVETHAKTIDDAFARKQKFIAKLFTKLGEQKIDLVLNMLNFSKKLPIYEIAKDEGVKII